METLQRVVTPCVRWMVRRDLPEVLRIEGRSFPEPWSEEDFLTTLRERNTIGMAAEVRGLFGDGPEQVAGYVVYELAEDRLRVLNLAVAPEWRRAGVGTALVDRLKSKLGAHRRNRVELVVSELNLPAQVWLRRRKFLAEEVIRGHFTDGSDGYRMAYEVEPEEGE